MEKFLSMLAEILDESPEALAPEQPLADHEDWDSLAVVSFIAAVEKEYGKLISGEALASAETVGDLWKLVDAS